MSHVKKLASGKYQARCWGSDGREHARNLDRKRDADYWLDEETRRVRRGRGPTRRPAAAPSRSGLPPTSATCT